MLVTAFRVGLLITDRCNVECYHCWFDSSPHRENTMKKEEAVGYIDQAGEIPSVEWISITGGEPFLYPELLESSVRHASKRGLRTECVTNCFWAESEEEADETLGRLVEAGLDVINVSADDFHQRYIPFDRVLNCYNAAMGLGIKTVVLCAAAKSSVLRAKTVKRILGGGDIQILRAGDPRPTASAVIVETGFTPVGRGAHISRDEWLLEENPVGGPCDMVLRDIGVSPSGRVLPCCSAASLVEEACLGSVREESLIKILERAARWPLFRTLSTEGPSALAERMGMKEKGYVGRCHLCYEVLTSPGLRLIL